MKHQYIRHILSALITTSMTLLIVGCATKERVVTYDVTKSGENWVENQSVQKRQGPDGKIIVEEQSVYEKVKCVDRKGRKVKANSPDECIDQGGKIIDEILIEEQTLKNK